MFEEEAKEFQKQIQQEYLDLGKNGAYPPLWDRIGELWGKGAEFGYNKAKEEWKKHFMQCSSPFCLDIFSSVKCYGELGNMAKKEGGEK